MTEPKLEMLMKLVQRAMADLRSYKEILRNQQAVSHLDLAQRIASLGNRMNELEVHLTQSGQHPGKTIRSRQNSGDSHGDPESHA